MLENQTQKENERQRCPCTCCTHMQNVPNMIGLRALWVKRSDKKAKIQKTFENIQRRVPVKERPQKHLHALKVDSSKQT